MLEMGAVTDESLTCSSLGKVIMHFSFMGDGLLS